MSADPTTTGVGTVFVKGLPETATSEQLETVFQEIGPVRRAFVVTEKGSTKCRGFGYVQFSLQADLLRALKRPPQLQGQRLTVSPALPRRTPEAEKKAEGDSEGPIAPSGPKTDVSEVLTRRALGRERKRKARTLVVAHAAAEGEAAKKAIGSEGSVAAGTYLRPSLVVTCAHPAGAVALAAKLNKSKSPRLHASPLPTLPPARLVARNVPFEADAKALLALFSRFGFVLDLTLNNGVAFIQYMDMKDATRAQRRANGKEVSGRPIAVDWAVAKSKYQNREAGGEEGEEEEEEEEEEEAEAEEVEGSGGESSGGDGDEESEGVEEEDEDEDKEEEEEEEGPEASEGANSEDGEGEEGDEEEDEEEEEEEEKEEKKVKREGSSDVGRGGTLFLKNLPFDVDEADVVRKFKRWGEVRFCNIVYDRETGLSRGTAFVTYKEPAAAAAALAELGSSRPGGVLSALSSSALQFRGRPVTVLPAVERGAALKMREKAPAVDRRNLGLLHEGVLPRPHLEELGVPAAEIQLREQLLRNRKQKLRNPNFYISPTRLAIMNLPRTLTVAELRKVMGRVGAAPGQANKLTQVKIMRDRNDLDEGGQPRSKGFAFVEFADKDQALAALRLVNNSTEYFGPRRPIVEFAVENSFITKSQEKKVQALQNNPAAKKPAAAQKPKPRGTVQKLSFSQPDANKPGQKRQKRDVQPQKPKANQRKPQKPVLEQLLEKEDSKKRTNRATESAPKRKKQEERDDFDDLVAQYRTDASSQKKMKKWFT